MADIEISDQQRIFIDKFVVKLKDSPLAEMCGNMKSVVSDDLARFSGSDPDAAREVQARIDLAAQLEADGQVEEALRLLLLAAEDIANLSRAARDAGKRDEVMAGKVSFEALIVQWNARRAELQSQLDSLGAAISQDDDEDAGFDVSAKLNQILGKFDNRLTDALDGMRIAADAAALKQQAASALGVTREYLGTLGSDPLISYVADNPFGVDADANAILSEPLYEIESRLRGFAD